MSFNQSIKLPVVDNLLRIRMNPYDTLSEKNNLFSTSADVPIKPFPSSSIFTSVSKWKGICKRMGKIIALLIIVAYLNEKVAVLQQDVTHLQSNMVLLQATVQTQSLQLDHLERRLNHQRISQSRN